MSVNIAGILSDTIKKVTTALNDPVTVAQLAGPLANFGAAMSPEGSFGRMLGESTAKQARAVQMGDALRNMYAGPAKPASVTGSATAGAGAGATSTGGMTKTPPGRGALGPNSPAVQPSTTNTPAQPAKSNNIYAAITGAAGGAPSANPTSPLVRDQLNITDALLGFSPKTLLG